MMFIVFFLFFLLVFITQILIWIYLLKVQNKKGTTTITQENISISVIVCARNEAQNLAKLIPSILIQNYSNFELILVDDDSTDNTFEILEAFGRTDQRIKILKIKDKKTTGKKSAIKYAIENAINNYLLFTDADCFIPNKNWISSLIINMNDKTELVLAYGDYEKKPGLLNLLIRWECLRTAIQFYSAAQNEMPYMGLGRNILWKKASIIKQQNRMISELAGGDDDLIVSSLHTSVNVDLAFEHESQTISVASNNWQSYFNQKQRHLTTANFYKPYQQLILGLINGSLTLFYLLFFMLLLSSWAKYAIIIFLMRYVIVYVIQRKWDKKFATFALPFWFPLLEVLTIFVQGTGLIKNIVKRKNDW